MIQSSVTGTVFSTMTREALLSLMALIMNKANAGKVTLTNQDILSLDGSKDCLVYWQNEEGYNFQVMPQAEALAFHERQAPKLH